ncbi:hypothetical protein CEXT_635371 [Caerostris extrusa]|uniref:Uncharacterized protein n=1 Tax=Caerostris extrusa TaxID=172846 RepID=A0AAV4UBR4_CAEEX|nr:hypothetical protein CEXT_635371 [Caerostris extrusa]
MALGQAESKGAPRRGREDRESNMFMLHENNAKITPFYLQVRRWAVSLSATDSTTWHFSYRRQSITAAKNSSLIANHPGGTPMFNLAAKKGKEKWPNKSVPIWRRMKEKAASFPLMCS